MVIALDTSFQAEALCDELKRYGVKASSEAMQLLLSKTGNHGVAVDAMLMDPRPSWLKELLGAKVK